MAALIMLKAYGRMGIPGWAALLLLLMPHLLSLGSPLVSIGGAGTFDGIFISGILALLLACLALERLGAKSKAS